MIRFPSDFTDLFQVLQVIGLASIIENVTGDSIAFRWDDGDSAEIDAGERSLHDVAEIIREHAARRRASDSWLNARSELDGKLRATLSPRVGKFTDDETWQSWQAARWQAIDDHASSSGEDWRFIGALGEPAYWFVGKLEMNPDWGASAWEMKTRNRGEEFVQNRLALLANAVATRTPDAIADGIAGIAVSDEVGKNKGDSRTPTGLRAPSRADNAAAWAALWGFNAFPVRPVTPAATRPRPRSHTAGALFVDSQQWFAAPIPDRLVTVARYRSAARSAALTRLAEHALVSRSATPSESGVATPAGATDGAWLRAHGIGGVTLARKQLTATNAPEPWAVFTAFLALDGAVARSRYAGGQDSAAASPSEDRADER